MADDVAVDPRRFNLDDSPTLKKAWNSLKRVIGVRGPVGSGKSSWAVNLAIMKFARMQKPDRDGVRRTVGMVVRKTYKELERTALKTFLTWYPVGTFSTWNENKQTLVIKFIDADRGPIECTIVFQGMDTPGALEKLGSFEASWIWVNEARELPWAVIEKCNERIDRFPQYDEFDQENFPGCTRPALLLDTNSPDDQSWWYNLAEKLCLTDEKTREIYEFFSQPPGLLYTVNPDGSFNILGENPERENRNHLKPHYYMNQVPGASAVKIRVQLLNLYGANVSGKPVYPEYVESQHFNPLLTRPEPGLPIWRAWDFGRRPCAIFIQVDRMGHVNIFDEMTSVNGDGTIKNQGSDEFSDAVLIYCRATYPSYTFFDVGDPSGGFPSQNNNSTPFTILHDKGIFIVPGGTQVIHGDDGRLEAVRRGLRTIIGGRPMIQIGPKAMVVRKGFEGYYKYEEIKKSTASGVKITKPDPEKDQWSDPQDAIQYWATNNLNNFGSNSGSGSGDGHTGGGAFIPDQTNKPDAHGFYI